MPQEIVIAAGALALFALVLFGALLLVWMKSQAMAVVPVKYPCGFMPPA
jgi:hypothetical protein